MADAYGNRVQAFRAALARALERGGWLTALFHRIGPSISEENFRATLEIIREHEKEIWVAGMADAYKYQEERKASALELTRKGPGRLVLQLTCGTDGKLYDQPLTLELTLPKGVDPEAVRIHGPGGKFVNLQPVVDAGEAAVRFNVPPTTADYVILLP